MKHTRKISIALVIMMVLMMALAVIPASAVTMTGGEKLYLRPNSNWNVDNARFAIYVYGSGNAWASMTKVDGEDNLYVAEVPAGSWSNVIFCRMNPGNATNSWDTKWNQTSDLTYDGTKNCYEVKSGTWDKGGGTWSTYTPPECQHTPSGDALSNTATCTAAGVVTYKCSLCGEQYTKPAANLNHDFVDGDCSRCDVVLNTVYYDNANGWASVHFHTWSDAYDYTSWPGTAMTKEGNVWVASIPSDCTGIIFNNGNGGEGNQTDDITIPTDGNNFYAAGAWTTYNPGCQHVNKEEREAIPATCKDPGKNAGVYCNDCQTYIEGGEATSVSDEHNYVDGICSVCNGIDLTYTITVYFENNWDWTGLSVHYWYNGGETAWPGQSLTEVVGQNADGKNIYKVVIPARVNGFLFVGTGGYGQEQSNDVLPGETGYKNCVCYYMTYDEATSTKPAGTYDYHTYNNACDADCNVCGATREVGNHVVVNGKCENCNYTYEADEAFVEFEGAGIRYMTAAGNAAADSIALRFGYKFANIEDVLAWGWTYSANGVVLHTPADKHNHEGNVTNLVLTGIPATRIGDAITVYIWYQIEVDGEVITVCHDQQVRITEEVLNAIVANAANESAECVTYAKAALYASGKEIYAMYSEIVWVPAPTEDENN